MEAETHPKKKKTKGFNRENPIQKQGETSKQTQGMTKTKDYFGKSLGLNGMVRAFQKNDKYSEKYDDKLETLVRRFRKLAKMW